LENYIYTVRQTVNDEKFKDKFTSAEKSKMEQTIKDCQQWLDGNEHAEKDEYEAKQKEIEETCMPLLTKAYQGAGGGADGGMPNVSADGGARGPPGGVRVDEVD
jgi:heat shock 70kDa protein 1/2/6/8